MALVLVVLVLLALVLLGKARESLEAGRSKGRRRLGLEGAANQQVRGKQRGEVHVEGSARRLLGRRGHVGQAAGIDRGDVCAVAVRVARNRGLVGGEGAVREAQVVAAHAQSRKGLGRAMELGRGCCGVRHLHFLGSRGTSEETRSCQLRGKGRRR